MMNLFPFVAILGQERAKKALLLTIINENIGGLLLTGSTGTAKSTFIRSLPTLHLQKSIIELPLNATEEQVIGGLDVNHMTLTGEKRISSGLLARANGQFLYIDEVNLLSKSILNHVIDVVSAKEIHLERESISKVIPTNFVLLGTMNPEEGMLSSKSIDRFGLYVQMDDVQDITLREQIIKQRLQFEKNPNMFCLSYEKETTELQNHMEKSKALLKSVELDEEMKRLAVSIILEANCEGNRADYILLETAKAIAAYEGMLTVEKRHLQEAATFVLPHRMMEKKQEEQQRKQEPPSSNESNGENQQEQRDEKDSNEPSQNDTSQLDLPPNEDSKKENESSIRESVEQAVGEMNIGLMEPIHKRYGQNNEGTGKRNKSRSSEKMGRQVKSTLPRNSIEDISFLATIKSAAPYQRYRQKSDMQIVIESTDIHIKVREKRTGYTIIFLIDASGSMGVRKRMQTVKAAIISLLQEAYVKRDKVGLITFAKDESYVLLEPTRSVVSAERQLESLPTGGNTPLYLGLQTTLQRLSVYKRKDPQFSPFVVLVTDGRASTTEHPKEHWQQILGLCQSVHQMGARGMVIDTEDGMVQLGLAKELAESLQATYYKMPKIESQKMVGLIRKNIG